MVIDQADYDKTKKKKIEVNEPECQDSSKEIHQEFYGITLSDSHYGAYYLITGKDKLNCSCPGKNCKHLREIQNGNRTCVRITRSVPEKDAEHNRR